MVSRKAGAYPGDEPYSASLIAGFWLYPQILNLVVNATFAETSVTKKKRSITMTLVRLAELDLDEAHSSPPARHFQQLLQRKQH